MGDTTTWCNRLQSRLLILGSTCVALAISGCGRGPSFQIENRLKPSESNQKLLLEGGGTPSTEGAEMFIRWAGGSDARILVVTWSTEDVEETVRHHGGRMLALGAASVQRSVAREDMARDKQTFLNQLADATGVFFSGGDQNEALNVIDSHPEVGLAIRNAYNRGIPMGGTSAGTAIMSEVALMGVNLAQEPLVVGLRNGLGLLSGLILDQHFIKRNRMPRLKAALQQADYPLGIGIDENAIFAVEGNRMGTVLGTHNVIVVDRYSDKVMELSPGDRFDIEKSTPVQR